jgi:glycosyltransferase involved in cell wall biosynthesis
VTARLPLLDLHDLGHQQTGNESWARSLAAALLELDGPGSYDIAVTSAASAQDLRRLPAREKVIVGSSSVRRLARDLPRAMRRLGTSVVLVQYTAPVSRVPAVVAVHDLSFEDPRAREWLPLRTRLRYRATIRTSVRRAAHILAVSEYTRQDLIRRYDVEPERVTVAHAAIDPAFAALIESIPAERHGPPTVLAVGNVLPRKNLVVVAAAVALMRSRGVDARLRVVGSVRPSGRGHAKEMRRLLGDALELSGYIDRRALAGAYRSAHVLAFPSLFEGFGIPVIEAMSAGLPVVVSDRTSLPEVVGVDGSVVPAEDPTAWAAALERAFDHGRELGLRSTERAKQFSWAATAAVAGGVLADAARNS